MGKGAKIGPIETLAKRPSLSKAGGVWVPPTAEEEALIEDGAKQFGKLCSLFSIEVGSSALDGEVPPIQRFGGRPMLEQEAFALRAGELSGIVQLGDKFVIMFCEGRTKPVNTNFDEVRERIVEDVRDKKMRVAMADEFTKIQDAATIDNFLAGTTQSPRQDERKMFQRVAAEEEVNPAVPRNSQSGAIPGKLPMGLQPGSAPTAPILR